MDPEVTGFGQGKYSIQPSDPPLKKHPSFNLSLHLVNAPFSLFKNIPLIARRSSTPFILQTTHSQIDISFTSLGWKIIQAYM